ncbi:SDR family NAD(P)-dependent oxidoreductase [Cupriavidus sp. PET2-C1]
MKKAIAIVGMSCRFPGGVRNPDDFWNLLVNEVDAITEIPADRFGTEFYLHPAKREPGKSYTFSAGVLDDIAGFDADFFGVSPREARQMDPQQRLLLELAWEAFENAGQLPAEMAGSNCAVFIGVASQDYGDRGADDLSVADAYSATGNTLSIASNRISYLFDLRGPSMSIDTACSSSLVALHQACNAIHAGEADTALAGGVNLLLHPSPFVSFAKASMLSPTGRCRAFDAAGDGYVRAEGGALVLLKPLDKALADGDSVHAVIVSSGVNSDGHSQGGINVPVAATQAALLNDVYARAGVDPLDIAYVEAHGTGTAVGDPIEARALTEVLGKDRAPDRPLLIGSAKTNVGHLETASGMAGLLKTVLCLKHKAVPATVHFRNPNPNIDFAGGGLRVVDQYQPLDTNGKPLLMGVNSFGFGGTNAHVLLGEAEARSGAADKTVPAAVPSALILSARSLDAVRELASRFHARLQAGASWEALASAVARKRQWLHQRAVILPTSPEDGMASLDMLARGESAPGVTLGEAPAGADNKLALVFSGNGSQWAGMGQRLLLEDAVFGETIENIDAMWQEDGSPSLAAVMREGATAAWLESTENAQPLLFALQVGVVRSLQARGLRYDACVGHSVGEVAAAWAAGALTLVQAVHVIKERSRAQATTAGNGKMAAAGVSVEAAQQLIDRLGLGEDLEVAGVNSPEAVTLAGSPKAITTMLEELAQSGKFFQALNLDYAFHSKRMDPIRDLVLTRLADLRPRDAPTPFISTVTGAQLPGTMLDAQYWWRNIREPVRFEAAARHLVDAGVRVFLEIGPHAILRSYVTQTLEHAKANGSALPTLKRNHDSAAQLQHAFCVALAQGASLDMDVAYPPADPDLALPTYPWQRGRHWLAPTSEGYDLVNRRREHPLLGYRLKDSAVAWENQIDPVKLPLLADHMVDGAVIFPGAGYAEMALAAARLHFGTETCAVENLEIRSPVVFQAQQGRLFRFTVDPRTNGFVIETRPRLSTDPWTIGVAGRLLPGGPAAVPAETIGAAELAALEAASDIDGECLYGKAAEIGLNFGPAFKWVKSVRVAGDTAVAELVQPAVLEDALAPYAMHPAAIDGGFHPLLALIGAAAGEDEAVADVAAYVPVQMGRIDFYGRGEAVRRVVARIELRSPHSLVASFTYLDAASQVVMRVGACRFRRVDLQARLHAAPSRFAFVTEARPYAADISAAALPAPATLIATAAAKLLAQEDAAHRRTHLTEVMPLLDVLAAAYALRAVEAMDVLGQPQLPASANPALLERLIGMLLEDGVLARRDGLLVRGNETLPAIDELWRSLLSASPGHVAELTLLAHCGAALPAVLDGRLSPQVVLPNGHSSLVDHLYEASPTWTHVNALASACLDTAVEAWDAPRPLRVLEVIAPGTNLFQPFGSHLQSRCDYAIAGSAEQLGAFDATEHPLIRTVQIELGDTPSLAAEPGRPAQYDILIINNLLRAGAHPARLIEAARAWMTPSALLIVAESQSSRFSDIVFGLSPDWWTLGRGELLGASAVIALLQEHGFETPVRHTEADLELEGVPAFLLARRGADPVAAPAPVAPAAQWLLLNPAARGRLMAAVSDTLQADSTSAQIAVLDSVQGLLAHPSLGAAGNAPCHVVFLAADIDGRDAGTDGEDMMRAQASTSIALAQLVRGLADAAAPVRLWVVSRGGAPLAAPGAQPSSFQPEQATLWGLGRVLMNEYAELSCHLIDIDPACERPAPMLVRELLSEEREEEVLLTRIGRFVPRMLPCATIELREQGAGTGQPDQHSVLAFESPGSLRHLQWFALEERELTPDEVEIEPAATGLNFRDVMYALGLLSDEAVENGFAGPTIGMELSGRITRVGKDVQDFAPGDAVLGFAPACFASRVRTRAGAVALKPERLSFEEAATIPTTFFTAFYALCELARLRKGERVLVHGAAGGVGVAAIQLARHLGAEVFATASTNEKREFVRLLGADHVFDSRSLAFADDILLRTGGQGVDIVLNSLAGEAMVRSIDVLRPFGRFLELGKRDFYENSRIGLRPFRNNISYFGIDADQLMHAQPGLTARLFAEIMKLLASGTLDPLPYRTFPAHRVEEAFRYMQQARQIGKIVITFPAGTPAPQTPKPTRLALNPQAAYLVAGGTGGLGFATARWLVDRGARHVVLASRSGALSEDLAAQARQWHETLGVTVTVASCDLTDGAAVKALVTRIENTGTPLKGVVHSAMTIADGLIANLDDERFSSVLAPKVAGAWNLHRATHALPLDFFVAYSSATTFLGSPGQSSYVAANTFLESLVHLRRASGLPGCFMAWGPLEDVGFLARNAQTREALQARIGGRSITSAEAMAALEHALLANRAGEAVLWLDWQAVARVMPAARSLRYVEMLGSDSQDAQRAAGSSLDGEVRALPHAQALQLVIETMQAQIARILHLSAKKVDIDRSVVDLGMDSLMGMELGMAVEESFKVKLSVMLLADGATVRSLAQKIVDSIRTGGTGEMGGAEDAPSEARQKIEALVARHALDMDAEDIRVLANKVESNASAAPALP